MAGVYGVEPADVAAELPGLFPVGFTQVTPVKLAQVTTWINDADTYIDTVVSDVVTQAPGLADTASQLAKRYIIDEVILRVYRANYAGKVSPAVLVDLTEGLGGAGILERLQVLLTAALAVEASAALLESRVLVSYEEAPRSLVVDTTDLDPDSGYRGRW